MVHCESSDGDLPDATSLVLAIAVRMAPLCAFYAPVALPPSGRAVRMPGRPGRVAGVDPAPLCAENQLSVRCELRPRRGGEGGTDFRLSQYEDSEEGRETTVNIYVLNVGYTDQIRSMFVPYTAAVEIRS